MTRASHHENQHNIDERISLARRTLYKLMNTGVHGSNGINPKVGYKIYQVFVLPRLLHSLEVLPLNISQIKKLSDFHIGTLRKLQSLPQRTSSAAVYLLLGALPIEPELERRHLSLLYSILNSKNTKLNEIRVRQTSLQESVPHSFFTRCSQIIERYCLPSTDKIKFMSKNVWKQLVKKKVRSYWSTQLLDEYLQNYHELLLYQRTQNRTHTPSLGYSKFQPHRCPKSSNKSPNANWDIHSTNPNK